LVGQSVKLGGLQEINHSHMSVTHLWPQLGQVTI